MQKILIAAVIMFGASCTTLTKYHESRTPAWVAERTTVEYDEFTKRYSVESPRVKGTMGSGYDGEYYRVFLRGWRLMQDEPSEVFQIYVATSHIGDWHHYRSAWDEDGKQLSTTRIASDVGCRSGCWYAEDVGVSVDRAYLEAHRSSGIRFKVKGTGGSVVVRVPPGYISGFLQRFSGIGGSQHAKE